MIPYTTTVLPAAFVTVLLRRFFDSFADCPPPDPAMDTFFNALSAPFIAATTGAIAYGWNRLRNRKITETSTRSVNRAPKVILHGIMKPTKKRTSWFLENIQRSRCAHPIRDILRRLFAPEPEATETSTRRFDFDGGVAADASVSSVFETPNSKIEIIDLTWDKDAGREASVAASSRDDDARKLKTALLDGFRAARRRDIDTEHSICSSSRCRGPMLIKSKKDWDSYQSSKQKKKSQRGRKPKKKRWARSRSPVRLCQRKTRSGKIYYK